MNNKKLKLKGLRVPGLLLWILGFIHSHILRTVLVDEESGKVSSGYIEGKLRLFKELTARSVKQLEEELHELRLEASKLMAEDSFLRERTKKIDIIQEPRTVNDYRKMKKQLAEQQEINKRHHEILTRLTQIDAALASGEIKLSEELQAVSGALQNKFAAYIHGVLMKPVAAYNIPEVTCEGYLDDYKRMHKKEDESMKQILEEVYIYA